MVDKQTETPGEHFGQVPIEALLEALASETELPDEAVIGCFDRFEEAVPALRAVLAHAADGERLTDNDATLLFRGLHILGAHRDTSACRPLLKLLRRPEEDLDFLLGDLATVSLPRIMAGVFDGDTDAFFDAIADRKIDEFSRHSLLGAAAFLTWDDKIDAARMVGFLERFHREGLADDGDVAWGAWLLSIAMLGLKHLVPLAKDAWRAKRIPPEMMRWQEFEEILAQAESAPDDIKRFEREHLGYIDDALRSLEWSRPAPKIELDKTAVWPPPPQPAEPVRNPMRHVGRNDPCPCGSGKKAKKCCLNK
jgi:hypothetical protein